MFNTSISSIVQNRVFHSPIILGTNKLSIFNCKFYNFFDNCFFSNRIRLFHTQGTLFSNFLSSPIHIHDNNHFINQVYTIRQDISSLGTCSISYCVFSSCVSTNNGGGVYFLSESSNCSILSSLFVDCHCVNSGGSYYLKGYSLESIRTCSNRCYHTTIASYINGGGGFMQSSYQSVCNMVTVYECSPKTINSGHCCFAHFDGSQSTLYSNASKCYGYTHAGYFHYRGINNFVRFNTFNLFNNCYNSFMIYSTNIGTFNYCNLLNNSVTNGALYSTNAAVTISYFCFFGNTQDTFLQSGAKLNLEYCTTNLATGFNHMNNGLGNTFGYSSFSPVLFTHLPLIACNKQQEYQQITYDNKFKGNYGFLLVLLIIH